MCKYVTKHTLLSLTILCPLDLTVPCSWYTFSLLGSFVPFGGFFPAPSNFRNPLNSRNQIFTRCHSCNEKCENEVASILKVGSATLVAGDKYPENLPCWSQTAEHDTGKGVDVPKVCDPFHAGRFYSTLNVACVNTRSSIITIAESFKVKFSVLCLFC